MASRAWAKLRGRRRSAGPRVQHRRPRARRRRARRQRRPSRARTRPRPKGLRKQWKVWGRAKAAKQRGWWRCSSGRTAPTLAKIMEQMRWQKHTVPGFMAGAMQKPRYTVESFKSDTVADGILDRLVYNAHRIEMRADSMRKG